MRKKINDLESLTCLESGRLATGKTPYRLVLLAPQHIDAIKTLHDEVIARLPEDQKTFVLPRTREYFESHLQRGRGSAVMGVISNGELVAKCLIVHPEAGESGVTLGGAILQSAPEHTSIIQSSTVHPDYERNGIMNMMIRHWLDHARRHRRTHVQAEVETSNEKSWRKLLNAGLNIVGAHKSPVDGARVYNAGERIKYTLLKDFSESAKYETHGCFEHPVHDIAGQMEKFSEGYIATAALKRNDCFVMVRK